MKKKGRDKKESLSDSFGMQEEKQHLLGQQRKSDQNTEMATDDSMYVKYVNKYARNVYYAGVGMYFLFR